LRPIQRLPQYKLLLEKYVKYLSDDPQHPDREDAFRALTIVSEAAEHTNERLRMNEGYAQLLAIQKCLRNSYELLRPHRKLLKKGLLQKISRKGTQERLFLLCSDCLIYLSVSNEQSYRVHHELPLAGMRVEQPPHEFITEIHVHSRTRSIRVLLSSSEQRQEWADAIRDAIGTNRQRRASLASASQRSSHGSRRIRFSTASTNETDDVACEPNSHPSVVTIAPATVPTPIIETNLDDAATAEAVNNGGDTNPPPLGSEAPIWVPDSRVSMCQLCTCEFTLTVRRHHCRACGQVVCSRCSSARVELPYMRRKQRVCDSCHDQLQADAADRSDNGATRVLLRSNLTIDSNELTVSSITSGVSSCNSLDSMTIAPNGTGSAPSLLNKSESFGTVHEESPNKRKIGRSTDAFVEERSEDDGESRRRSIGAIRSSAALEQRRSSGNSVFFTGWSTQAGDVAAEEESIDVTPELSGYTSNRFTVNETKSCGVQRSQSQSSADAMAEHLARVQTRTSGRRRNRVPKRLCEVSANDPNSEMAGYMWKRIAKRNWKRFWFVVKDKVLYTYRESEDVAALQTLPLLGYLVQPVQSPLDGHSPEVCLEIKHANQPTISLRLEHSAFFDK
jgi:hypothetical protein